MHQSPSSTTADYVWGIVPQQGVRLSIAYDTKYGFEHENWLADFTDARWVDANGNTISLGEDERDTWRDAAHYAYRRDEDFRRDIKQACKDHWEVRQQWLRLCESGPVDGSCEVEATDGRRIA